MRNAVFVGIRPDADAKNLAFRDGNFHYSAQNSGVALFGKVTLSEWNLHSKVCGRPV